MAAAASSMPVGSASGAANAAAPAAARAATTKQGGRRAKAAPEERSGESYESSCLPAEANQQAATTARLLMGLEELMADYRPVLPTPPDSPERCLTHVAEANDPQGAKVEHLLEKDYRKRADEARRKADAIMRHFDEVDLPLAWTWVTAIVAGHEFALAPGVLVKEPTELMKRLAARPDLKVDVKQHCIVADAEVTGGRLVVSCRGPARDPGERFYVEVDPKAGGAAGALATVGVSDLIEFSGFLLLTHKPRAWREPPRWTFQSTPAEGVKVVAESTCCHTPGK
jgi:hypothetical protein